MHQFSQLLHFRPQLLLNEDVVVETIVAMLERHKAHYLGTVMFMIWRKAIGWQVDRIIVRTNTNRGKAASNQVMHHGNSLRGKPN